MQCNGGARVSGGGTAEHRDKDDSLARGVSSHLLTLFKPHSTPIHKVLILKCCIHMVGDLLQLNRKIPVNKTLFRVYPWTSSEGPGKLMPSQVLCRARCIQVTHCPLVHSASQVLSRTGCSLPSRGPSLLTASPASTCLDTPLHSLVSAGTTTPSFR